LPQGEQSTGVEQVGSGVGGLRQGQHVSQLMIQRKPARTPDIHGVEIVEILLVGIPMKIDDGLPGLVGDHPVLGDLARQVAHRRIIGRTAHPGHVPLVQVGQKHVIPVEQGVQVDRDDSPCVQSPERREVIGHVQQGFLAPSTAVVPPALGTSGELGVEVGPLRLVQSGFGAKGGVKVLDIAFRARGRVDRDVVSVDRMVLARVRGRDRDGSVDSPPFEFGLRSPAQ
jgi:hypothetical protein